MQNVRADLSRDRAQFSAAFSQRERPDELNPVPQGVGGARRFGEVSTNATLL
jgi:hypothetical protein